MRTLARNPAAWGRWSQTRPAGLGGRLLMLTVWTLGLLAVGPLRPVRGEQPPESLTAEQRQQPHAFLLGARMWCIIDNRRVCRQPL